MTVKHTLNCFEIDDQDELDDGCQLCRVWCETHRKYEWHNIPLEYVRFGGVIVTTRKPLAV